jgi:hypothetical protein
MRSRLSVAGGGFQNSSTDCDARTMRRRSASRSDAAWNSRRTTDQNETELYSPPAFNRRRCAELLYDVRAVFGTIPRLNGKQAF